MSVTVLTGAGISMYRLLVLKHGLRLELKGIRRSRGTTCYAQIKREFGLRGSRTKVLADFSALVDEKGELALMDAEGGVQ